MTNKLTSLVLLLICFNVAFSQQKHTISGYINDDETGEGLIGATIFINELKSGGITNVYGFYSITIPEGKYTIELEQVVITAEAADKNIKSAGEGNSGFYVRGGGADQNLILLDEAPVYNASHLLGFFSVFNSDAINNKIISN